MNQSASQYQSYDHDSVGLDPRSPFFLDHVSRYWWASQFARGQNALDCACGHGYGSYILSHQALQVTGIDLNTSSLEVARRHFQRANLEFTERDVLELDGLGKKYGLITAFEMIEHIPPRTTTRFLESLARTVASDGLVLISTPNHDVVTKSGVPIPEFHINNFKPAELRKALKRHFEQVILLGQYRRRSSLNELAFFLDRWNLRHRFQDCTRKSRATGKRAMPVESASQCASSALYDNPPPGVENYRMSPWHWRQAGLTVALCRRPTI